MQTKQDYMTRPEVFEKLLDMIFKAYTTQVVSHEELRYLINDISYVLHMFQNPMNVEEALDSLSLAVEYMAFDIEALRRENRYLRCSLLRKELDYDDDEGPECSG